MGNPVEEEKRWEGVSLHRGMGGPNVERENKLGKKERVQSSEGHREGWKREEARNSGLIKNWQGSKAEASGDGRWVQGSLQEMQWGWE